MQQAELDGLVLAAQSGNADAFGMLVRYLQPSLLRFSYHICKDQHMANDAAQEVWLQCCRNLRTLRDPRALKSWLHRAVRWRTLDLLRKQQRQQSSVSLSDEAIVCDETCGSESPELREKMQGLPAIERQALHLFYLEDLTIKEISAVLGIPSGTVKSRLNRARNSLQAKLE
jgi:RNA polymerase sigma-70 factor (ECF subfamily)